MVIFGIFMMLLIMQISYATAENEQKNNESSVSSDQTPADQGASDQAVPSGETQATKEATSTEATSTDTKEASVAVLLADTHKSGGVECSDCHKETPPASEVPTEICMTCHEDYRDVASSAVDPHNAHVEFTSCGDCHHSHKESENQCLSCHSFDIKTP